MTDQAPVPIEGVLVDSAAVDLSTGTPYTEQDWALDPQTIARLAASVPAATHRAYIWRLRAFAAWCAVKGRRPLPATEATLTAYVDDLIQIEHRSPATVEQAIGLIRGWHKRNGHPQQPPTTGALDLLRGYNRKRAENDQGQKQAIPFDKATLHQCIESLDLETLAGRRVQMILVFGFLMMARRRVLSSLRFSDITETPDGLDIRVRADKTDKQSEGRVCSLPPQSHPDGDPVRVLRAWRDQLAGGGHPAEGPLLCRFSRASNPIGHLSGDAINTIVRAITKQAHVPDWNRYTAHSLRAGGLVDALRRGVPPGIAARHGGWDPESPMLGRYSRVANRWKDNAMRGAL